MAAEMCRSTSLQISSTLMTDLPTGSKYTLREVRKLVEDDPALLPREEKKKYISELVEHRALKTSGSRANNIAAARDVLATTERSSRNSMDYAIDVVHIQHSSLQAVT
ncbi:uncharacterized protein HD556DRAFT_1425849 [Suillus plorans]|uniref:Uncharacterized protein n=1 Tax=Suillus plorans TaxID=116603 RepID=A0A9P7A9C0_9AGAM|nr:uncharacterized protein HD556DRAFT_1425849 [Suillus plorans]KAG1784809.1 hypothetical protein HD556DRAFT_1425849 [Suillus plorans]